MLTRLAVACALWVVASPALGQSSDLQAAQAAYEASDLDEVSARLDAALRSGTLVAGELALAHRLLGILAVADGDDERALAEFAVSLALHAEQETPTELGPEQAALFDGIRAGRAPLQLELEAGEVARGGRFELTHATPTAPEGLVARYEIEARAPGTDPWRVESNGETQHDRRRGVAWCRAADRARARGGRARQPGHGVDDRRPQAAPRRPSWPSRSLHPSPSVRDWA